jgi:hypothetical protein
MNRSIARRLLGAIFAIGLIAGMAAPAYAGGPPCSLARAAGNWAFTDNGTVVGVGPRTAVGTLTLDAAGNLLNGLATSSLNGAIDNETFSGTYTVNPDCTGTVSVDIFASGIELFAVTLNIAFDHNMQHMRGIFTSVVEPNGTSLSTVVALDANKQ